MIKGKLVGLRAVEQEDLKLLRDWRNNPAFRRNFREVRELSMLDQQKWIEKTNASANDFFFVFEDLETGEAVGAGGLLYTNWIIRAADFSFYIGFEDSYIDEKGFAEDAADLLVRYAFDSLNLNKIWMELYEFDEKKIEFFTKKFNFFREGTLRDNCYEDRRYWNSYIYSLLRREYEKG